MCFAVGVAAGFREVSVLYAALQVNPFYPYEAPNELWRWKYAVRRLAEVRAVQQDHIEGQVHPQQ